MKAKPKSKRNKPEAPMSNAAYVQCPQMQSSRAAILGVTPVPVPVPVPVLPLACLPVGHFIVGPAEVPARTNFSLLPALDASTSPSRALILLLVLSIIAVTVGVGDASVALACLVSHRYYYHYNC